MILGGVTGTSDTRRDETLKTELCSPPFTLCKPGPALATEAGSRALGWQLERKAGSFGKADDRCRSFHWLVRGAEGGGVGGGGLERWFSTASCYCWWPIITILKQKHRWSECNSLLGKGRCWRYTRWCRASSSQQSGHLPRPHRPAVNWKSTWLDDVIRISSVLAKPY